VSCGRWRITAWPADCHCIEQDRPAAQRGVRVDARRRDAELGRLEERGSSYAHGGRRRPDGPTAWGCCGELADRGVAEIDVLHHVRRRAAAAFDRQVECGVGRAVGIQVDRAQVVEGDAFEWVAAKVIILPASEDRGAVHAIDVNVHVVGRAGAPQRAKGLIPLKSEQGTAADRQRNLLHRVDARPRIEIVQSAAVGPTVVEATKAL